MAAQSSFAHNSPDLRYLVVGLGQTGYSVAEFLTQQNLSFSVQDDRDVPPYLDALKHLNVHCDVIQQALSKELLHDFDCIVVSPGISVQNELFSGLIENNIEVIGDIELFARFNTAPVVAITGSNGKTTVTSLMGDVLKACDYKTGVGGNIGTPALALLAQQNSINVLELSSFQLETTYSLQPTVSVVLNVSEDHLDRYKDFSDYQRTKLTIHHHSGFIIINRDDENTYIDGDDASTEEVITFGLDEADDEDDFGVLLTHGSYWLCQGDMVLINTDDLHIKGKHNWANCLAVLAIADALDLSLVKTIDAITAFKGVEHRYEFVAQIDQVTWINDSKGTNPGATLAAIEGTDQPIILIAGGQSKNADISILNQAIKKGVKQVILLGEDSEILKQQWQDLTQIKCVESMQEAVDMAKQDAIAGDCVLLSPACASFDMYRGFDARGDDFKALVKTLGGL